MKNIFCAAGAAAFNSSTTVFAFLGSAILSTALLCGAALADPAATAGPAGPGEAPARGGGELEEIIVTATAGQRLIRLPEGSSYLGFIFARGNSPREVEAALRLAHTQLKFEIAERLPVQHPVTGTVPAL